MSKSSLILRWLAPFALSVLLAVSLLPLFHRLFHGEDVGEVDQLSKLLEVRQNIREHYVEPVTDDKLFEGALHGMVGTLDSESQYFPPADLDDFEADIRGEFGGVGMILSKEGSFIRVVTPLEDTPAFRAGILAGDDVLEIDGRSTEKLSVTEAMRLIRGPAGSKVVLVMRHAGEEPKRMTLERARIKLKTVKNVRFEDEQSKIAYLRITAFQENMVASFDEAVAKLTADGMRALIIDFRFNGGGLLGEALSLCDRFLTDGLMLAVVGRSEKENRVYEAVADGTLPSFPLAVLVNGGSASASEIFAGAMKDRKRGSVIGERTYGKGSVQQTYRISQDNSGLKLTIAHYHTPSGRRIGRVSRPVVEIENETDETKPERGEWGIEPDFVVRMTRKDMLQLQKAWSDSEIIAPPGGNNSGQSSSGGSEPAFVDRQLAKAVEELKKALEQK